MKTWSCALLASILVVTLGVGQGDTGKKAPQPPEVNKTTPQKPLQSPHRQPRTKEKEQWPRPFIPSEKINADSVVSFPADI